MGGWQTKFNVSPGPGLWSLVLGPFGPDLGPDLDLTWDLDLSLTITVRLLITFQSDLMSELSTFTFHSEERRMGEQLAMSVTMDH